MDADVKRRVAQVSRAFGALKKSFFLDKNLILTTKWKIYSACVLSVLLYGAECWIPLRKHEKKLNIFHHRCIRIILGISNLWREVRRWGDEELAKSRLEWLGNVTRMPDRKRHKCVAEWQKPISEQRGAALYQHLLESLSSSRSKIEC